MTLSRDHTEVEGEGRSKLANVPEKVGECGLPAFLLFMVAYRTRAHEPLLPPPPRPQPACLSAAICHLIVTVPRPPRFHPRCRTALLK